MNLSRLLLGCSSAWERSRESGRRRKKYQFAAVSVATGRRLPNYSQAGGRSSQELSAPAWVLRVAWCCCGPGHWWMEIGWVRSRSVTSWRGRVQGSQSSDGSCARGRCSSRLAISSSQGSYFKKDSEGEKLGQPQRNRSCSQKQEPTESQVLNLGWPGERWSQEGID